MKPPTETPAVGDRAAVLEGFAGGAGFHIYTRDPGLAAQEVAVWASARGLQIEGLCTHAPSLEDVFLQLTAAGPQRE